VFTERIRATAPGEQQGLPLHHRLAGPARGLARPTLQGTINHSNMCVVSLSSYKYKQPTLIGAGGKHSPARRLPRQRSRDHRTSYQ